jgi:alpha-tubulin suppressor-like RCC1 family protein
MATAVYPYTQYSGIWTMQQVNAAIAAGTWPKQIDPHLFTWGYNADGQLGLSNTTNYSSPKQVGSLITWSKIISSENSFSLSIKTDGTLWSWGNNVYGQLGLGNTTYYSSPKQIGALTNWSTAIARKSAVAAVKTDGTLWTWGYNAQGQLGLGNTTNYSSPKQVGALTAWLSVAASWYNFVATKTDGTLWA